MTYDFRSMHEVLNDVLNTAGTESLNVSLLLAGSPVNSTTPVPVSETGTTITVFSASIAKDGTRTGAIALDGRAPIRLLIPSTWAGTAAIVHVDVSDDGVAYYPLWSASTAYTVSVLAGKASVVDPTTIYGAGYIRLVGTQARGTAAAQSTAVTVGVVARLI